MQANTRTVSRLIVSTMINASEGTFIGCEYIRKDGSYTTLNGRLYCKRDTVSGRTSGAASRSSELFTLYDVKRKGYRSISLDRLLRVTLRGITFRIAD